MLKDHEKQKNKEKEITLENFEFVYNNKILPNLKKPDELSFSEIEVLLKAYEYYRYEKKKSKSTFKQLEDQQWK